MTQYNLSSKDMENLNRDRQSWLKEQQDTHNERVGWGINEFLRDMNKAVESCKQNFRETYLKTGKFPDKCTFIYLDEYNYSEVEKFIREHENVSEVTKKIEEIRDYPIGCYAPEWATIPVSIYNVTVRKLD